MELSMDQCLRPRSKCGKVCIKNACVGYLLVLQEGDSRRYISYKQFGPIPDLISCARVTGRWILPSHVQNAVRWLTLNLEPSLSVPDFVLQLDKSRKKLRLSGLIQKVSM